MGNLVTFASAGVGGTGTKGCDGAGKRCGLSTQPLRGAHEWNLSAQEQTGHGPGTTVKHSTATGVRD